MDVEEFDKLISGLRAHLRGAVKEFLQAKGLPFEADTFVQQTSLDLDQFAKELLFYGSDVFPTTEPVLINRLLAVA